MQGGWVARAGLGGTPRVGWDPCAARRDTAPCVELGWCVCPESWLCREHSVLFPPQMVSAAERPDVGGKRPSSLAIAYVNTVQQHWEPLSSDITHCMLTRRSETVGLHCTLLPIYFVHWIGICAEVISCPGPQHRPPFPPGPLPPAPPERPTML